MHLNLNSEFSSTDDGSRRREQAIGELQVELIESLEALRALEPEWRQFLAEGVCGSSFFNDPLYLRLQLEIDPQWRPWILVLRREGRIRCIAPFYLGQTKRKIQFSVLTLACLRLRMLRLWFSEFIVAHDEHRQECYSAVFRTLSQHCRDFDLVLLEHLDVRSPLWNFCKSAKIKSQGLRSFPAASEIDTVYQVRLPATHEAYMAQLNPKTRHSLRRKTRKLLQEYHVRFEQFTKPEQVPECFEQLDVVYRSTWQAKLNGYQVRNTPAAIRMHRCLAQQGWFRSYLLISNEGPLAYVLGYQYQGVFYHYETGYLSHRREWGPGSVCTHLLIENLIRDNPPVLTDFLPGDQAYKRSFANSQHRIGSLYLVPRNRFGWILRLQQTIFAFEHLARRITRSLNLDRGIRNLLRRMGIGVRSN